MKMFLRVLQAASLIMALTVASTVASGAPPPRGTCAAVCIDVFGGALPLPAGYRLQLEFGDVLRFVRIDPDPRQGHGHIYIGKAEKLPPREERERSARELGATVKTESHGALRVEVTTRTVEQLLSDKPLRYESVLIYDNRHYMEVTDSSPGLWRQMLKQCDGCST